MKTPWYKRLLPPNYRIKQKHSGQRSKTTEKQRAASAPTSEASEFKEQNRSFTVSDLNLDAARRQASLGKGYARHSKTQERLLELKKSIVTLPPHRPWTGKYTNWTADPLKDLNWRFQFHTLRWINPYLWDALDGNDESKAEWKRIVRSWGESNTPPDIAQDKYAWMDMTDGNRAIQTSIGAPLIDQGEQWYVDLLVEHRNWLLDDSKIVPGNHGLHQNLGLFVVSAVLNDQRGIQKAIERLSLQINDVFEKKGLNEEGSVAYHQTNLDWWLQAQKRLVLEGYAFPPEVADRLHMAGKVMGYLLLPDGSMPQIGDGGRGRGRLGLHPFLDQVVNGKIHEENLPTFNHFYYGFIIFRSGWGEDRPLKQESHTIIRHGLDLRRHSHNDRGSVHLYTLGRRWITDGGFHSYQQRNRDRRYTKSRLAHSLLDIPGQKYDKTGDVPVQNIQSENDFYSVEILDDNFESATWRRRVTFLPKQKIWIIWDRVQTNAKTPIQQQWLIDVDVDAVPTNNDSIELLDTDTGHKLYMKWLGDQPDLDIVRGDLESDSKRGLIGIAWKKMRSATSLHATFLSANTESVVIVSERPSDQVSFEIVRRKSMKSFDLEIKDEQGLLLLRAKETASSIERDA